MPFVSVGGIDIHYTIEGSERLPALLLLNSLGTSLSMWDDQLTSLIQRFRIIRYDMRGHGESSPTNVEGCSISNLATDALAVLDAAGAMSAHWCGLSIGGMIAMWAASHRSERVNRLVLSNTSAYLPPASLWQSRMELVLRDGMSAIAEAIPLRWFTPSFCAESPLQVARIRGMLLDTDARSYAALCGAIKAMDQRPDLKRVRCPTLVVAGSSDPATPADHSEALHAAIVGSQLSVLNAAHLSNVEAPEEFSSTVSRFLSPGPHP